MNTQSSLNAAAENNQPLTGLELRSCITRAGELQLSLVEQTLADPADNEVIVRVEASPLNPSDIGLMFGPADMSRAVAGGTPDRPTLTAPVPAAALDGLALRLDQSLTVGNEGAGVVVRAGKAASAMLGKTVSMAGGGMYAQYRKIDMNACMVLDEGVSPEEGASAFINPLTALGMVETMKREGHKALVHTAAASNLGQMLVKLCEAEGIELVNIVRSDEQMQLLRDIGARHVVNSTSPDFEADLTDALAQTGATLCFDALSGGPVARQVLTGMEKALTRGASDYSRYGSPVHKQVYMYGGLDTRPIEVPRVGMAWGIGGWLVFPFLQKIGPDAAQRLRERANAGLRSIFASRYKAEISLADALTLDVVNEYLKRRTGEKYLINPAMD